MGSNISCCSSIKERYNTYGKDEDQDSFDQEDENENEVEEVEKMKLNVLVMSIGREETNELL